MFNTYYKKIKKMLNKYYFILSNLHKHDNMQHLAKFKPFTDKTHL